MSTPPRGSPRKPPAHFSVPGTNFTVDWHCKTFPNYIHSFLSHAHSDHLAGIQGFRQPRVLHCTEITAKMLVLKVPKVKPCIVTCQPNTSFTVEGVKVHVLEANHTPGSAMFVFILKNGRKILHTGDFRAEPIVIQGALPFAPIDHLFIDCTYANTGVNVPPRSECVTFVVERLKDLFSRGFFSIFGTYTIGKESLIFDVAEKTNAKIYAPETRMQTLIDLTSTGWRTSDYLYNKGESSLEAQKNALIHVTMMGECSGENAIEYCKKIGKTKVVTFAISGWCGRNGYWQAPQVFQKDGIEVIAYNIPFSDHSSQKELCEFVNAIKPCKVTPTTQTTVKAIEKVHKLFFPYIRKEKNKRFIDFYCESSQKSSQNTNSSQNNNNDNDDVVEMNEFCGSQEGQCSQFSNCNSQFDSCSQTQNPIGVDDSQCFMSFEGELQTSAESEIAFFSEKPTPIRMEAGDALTMTTMTKTKFLTSDDSDHENLGNV